MANDKQNTFYGLVYDIPKDRFRDQIVVGEDGIFDFATDVIAYSQSDSEPYGGKLDCLDDAFDVIEDYSYEIVEVSKEDADLYQTYIDRNETFDNRMDYTLMEEFKRNAKNFVHQEVKRQRFGLEDLYHF